MIVERTQFPWKVLVEGWLRWDSAHYLTIATKGYSFFDERWPNIAFFPLYPLLIRLFLPLTTHRAEISALAISHFAIFAALLLLYDLITRDFNEVLARRTLILLLVFPMSFFFISGYTESLALALTVLAMWALRQQRWWLAGLAGFFLALTRVPGVFVAPVLVIEYLQQHKWNWRKLLHGPILSVVLPPLGLALFILFQWQQFGTPFAFMIAQQSWENNELSPPWVMPTLLFQRYHHAPDWPLITFYLLTWIGFIGLIVVAFVRLPLSYGLLMLLLLFPSYLTSWHRSLPRHLMIGFPAFVVMALLLEQIWLRRFVIAIFGIFLAFCTLLFVNAFWVA